MDRPSIGSLPSGRVLAIRKRFEGLGQELVTASEIATVSNSDNSNDDLELTERKNPDSTPRKGSLKVPLSVIKEPSTQRSTSPNNCSPSRSKPNTYQSCAASEFRRKYQQTPKNQQSDPNKNVSQSHEKVPSKPPRTFAHDVYVQGREEIKVLVDQKFRGIVSESSRRSRRRSHSADPITRQVVVRRPIPSSPYCNIADIFEPPSQIRNIIRESFGRDEDLPSLTDPVILADVEQEIIYARTLRMGLRGKTVSHYSSVVDLSTREACLCNYMTVYDEKSDHVIVYPEPSFKDKADFVKKFSHSCKGREEMFCWFAFTEPNFFYTYFLSRENRVISLSSELYSPRFFSTLLQAIASESQVLDKELVNELCSKKIPLPGEVITFKGSMIEVPWQLPHVVLTKPSILLKHLNPDVITKSVATLVQEKKLAFVSNNPTLLIDASTSLLALMYPLAWDYMYWPFVPRDLISFCAALTFPYFICLSHNQLGPFLEAMAKRSQKILIIDLDTREIVQEVGNEFKILPKIYTSSLSRALSLCHNMTDPTGNLRDKVIEEAFLEVWIQLLGPVTLHISDQSPFCKKTFIRTCGNRDHRSFFNWFAETRLFENFVKYWQVRAIHSKFVPNSKKMIEMDPFERRTQFLRQSQSTVVGIAKQKPKVSSSIGWSGTAIRVVESRFNAISNKLKKHI